MGKVAAATPPDATKKRKKKGRPSLLDLEKRNLKLQRKQQQEEEEEEEERERKALLANPSNLVTPNSSRRSTRRNPNPDGSISPGDDDDERIQKKLRLVDNLPPLHTLDRPKSSASCDSDSIPDARRIRNTNAIGDGGASADQDEKASKATDTAHGSRLESGPTTPLPDKKLLVFILDRLQKKDTYGVFSEPVDPEELPDYHDIVKHPMDFSTVRKKLDCGQYLNLEQFEADVFLICENALQYNSSDTIYFRQARSIQELAKKDFENLRQDSEDSDSQPKVVRRGRPPKYLKKSAGGSPLETRLDSPSDATLASAEDNTLCGTSYNLRKGPRLADASVKAYLKSQSNNSHSGFSGTKSDSGSIMKSVPFRHSKKQVTLDDDRRDTYTQYLSSASDYESPVMSALDGGLKQLMVVGLHTEYGYARSLARFAADLGPTVWKIASRKIQSVLPAGVKFGPGWVDEKESQEQPSLLYDKQKASMDSMHDGDCNASLRMSSCSSSTPSRSSLLGKECQPGARESNPSSDFSSPNNIINGFRPEAPSIYHQSSSSRTDMNGLSGFNMPQQMGSLVPVASTSIGSSGGPLVLPQALGMACTSYDTSIGLSGLSHSRQFPDLEFSPGCNAVPETETCVTSSWQELPHHQKQGFLPTPPDLNVRFQTPAPLNSIVQINSPQQPDLALQL